MAFSVRYLCNSRYVTHNALVIVFGNGVYAGELHAGIVCDSRNGRYYCYVADSNAERVRRHRAHARGDHRLCDPRRCREARHLANGHDGLDDAPPPAADAPVLPEIDQWLATLTLPEDPESPARVLARLARQVAARLDSADTGVSMMSRELRCIIGDLADATSRPPTFLHEGYARRHARRIEAHIERRFADGAPGA
jgi:hypothetical protein